MKFLTKPISDQHLYLKIAILISGLVSGLDSSLIQLPKEGALFLLFMLLELPLYKSLLKAIRKIIPFLAGYWVFATIFAQPFPDTVQFSMKVLYLLLVTVYVFARPDFAQWAHDSRGLRRLGWINNLFIFCLSTLMFIHRFFAGFRTISSVNGRQMLVSSISAVFQSVAAESGRISIDVEKVISAEPQDHSHRFPANVLGIIFLSLLVIIHGV